MAAKTEKKEARKVVVDFVADSVTKNTVIFAECTATGVVKELKESLIGKIYHKLDTAPGFKENGINMSEPDENGEQFLSVNKIRGTFELME